MNRKFFYITLVVIAIVAGFLAFIFFPSYKTFSLMLYYDRDYEGSLKRYQKLYDENDHSISVVAPLSQIYLEFANTQDAIHILEEYLKNNPKTLDVLQVLSPIYMGADMPHHYVKTQEEIYELAPASEILQDLLNFYIYYGNLEKEKLTLNDLIFKFDTKDLSIYTQLAALYAAEGQLSKAIELTGLSLPLCKKKEECQYVGALRLSLLFDENREDEAYGFFFEMTDKFHDPFLLDELTILMFKRNQEEQLLNILKALPPDIQLTKEVIQTRVAALDRLGRTQEIFTYLNELKKENKLPPSEVESYVYIALKILDNPEELQEALLPMNLSHLSESTWQDLILKASEEKLTPLIYKIEKEIPYSVLSQHRILQFRLAIYPQETVTADSLAFYLQPDFETLTGEEKIDLASLYQEMGLYTLTREILQTISSWEEIPPSLYTTAAILYGETHMAEEGQKAVENLQLHKGIDLKELDIAALILSAYLGEKEEVVAWLALNYKELSKSEWLNLYYIAERQNLNDLLLIIAEYMLEASPTAETERLYAEALIANHRYEDGLKILTSLYETEPHTESLTISYYTALAILAEKNPAYLDEIDAFLSEGIPHYSKNSLRKLGYALLDRRFYQQAEPIFFKLAQGDIFHDPDIQALLATWGEHPSPKAIQWVVTKAKGTNGVEKGEWLEYLSYYAPEEVYSLVSEEELHILKIADAYFKALAILGYRCELLDLTYHILNQKPTTERILRLALIAKDEAAYDAAEPLYLEVLERKPNHEIALKNLGSVYFSKGAFTYARWYLGHYLCLYRGDAISFFEYGELFHRDEKNIQGDPFFLAALEASHELKPELWVWNLQALIYYRLNFPRSASHIYLALVELFPHDISIRADFGNMLIDLGCLGLAREILFDFEWIPSKSRAQQESLIYLGNVRTKWFERSGLVCDAFEHSQEMLTYYPEEDTVWAEQGRIEWSVERWRLAMESYTIANSLAPDNEDYIRSYNDIVNLHRPFLMLEGEYRRTGNFQKEHFLRAAASFTDNLYSHIYFIEEQDDLYADNLVNAKTGELIPDLHVFRYRGELSWLYDDLCGNRWKSSVFYAPHVFGVGGALSLRDLYGASLFGFDWNRPDWNYLETTVQYGSRDRLFIGREHRWDSLHFGAMTLGLNRYKLYPIHHPVADTVSWDMFYGYHVPNMDCIYQLFGRNASLVLSYSVDAEYPTWLYSRRGVDDITFNPLGIQPRETQIAQAILTKTDHRYFLFEANFGITYDRFGIHRIDYVYGANVSWNKRPGLTFKVLYDHSPSTQTVGQDVDRFVLNLTYFY